MNFYTYDLETYPNIFLFTGRRFHYAGDPDFWTFQISDWADQRDDLLKHLSLLQNQGVHMVGYNSLGFDYPVLHQLLNNPYTFTAQAAWEKAQAIIGHEYGLNPHMIALKDRLIPQIDLVKINHFDNPSKRTSLKALQFAMRAESVEDLPFDPMKSVNFDQACKLIDYNQHDVLETERFLTKCLPMIQMRKELLDNGVISGDVLNYSDVKIGTEYLISKIGRNACFLSPGRPRQTIRSSVNFRNCILPSVAFQSEPFRRVLDWFNQQTIWLGKKERPKLAAHLGGLDFEFGVGGVHASVESKIFRSDDSMVIRDVDVAAMYPSVAVANNFSPEHLGEKFITAYRQLQADRKQYPKGSMMNLVMKLANNGVFGNSNNEYSPFFDPKFTFSITINGQLQLLQLAEYFSLIPGVQIIQANTDGVTALVPRSYEPFFDSWCVQWESETNLKLEHATYDRMFIRDVNNYLAIDSKGKIKRKGAYWYPLTDEDYHGSSGSNWSKDFSNLTAQKGVEACLLFGYQPEDIVRTFTDPFDFMLRCKTPGGAKVYIGDQPQLKTVRYYVSTAGQPMKKIAAPKGIKGEFKRKNKLADDFYNRIKAEVGGNWDARIHTANKSRYEEVTTSIESGRLVKQCNRASDFDWRDVDFDYYTKEIEKLLIGKTDGKVF